MKPDFTVALKRDCFTLGAAVRFFLLIVIILGLGGCAGRRLPPYEEPLARAPFQKVRTTAYTHTEADHLRHGIRSARGTPLRYDPYIKSAAADWARWPAGTLFRIVETDELREVDDYGWALAGTNTIDLYMPDRRTMNQWGVRPVTLEILRWGDYRESRRILRPRRKHKHVKRMLREINEFY